MQFQDIQFVPAGQGLIHAVLGSTHINKALPEDTGDAFAVMEVVIPPRMGPPMHTHSADAEGFYMLAGELTFETPDGAVVGRPGDFCLLPAGGRHAFRNDGASDARALVIIAPGVEALRFFAAADAELRRPADMARVPELAAKGGIVFNG